MVNFRWGYWDRKLKAYTDELFEDRLRWENHLNYIYGRGPFAAGGGFRHTTAFYGVGGSCLGIGSVGGGMLDDETYLTADGISFIERWTGKTPVNQFGQWGYYVTHARVVPVPAEYHACSSTSTMTEHYPFFVAFENDNTNNTFNRLMQDVSFGTNLLTTKVSIAASGNSIKIIRNIGKISTRFGAITGIGFNIYDGRVAFAKGYNQEGYYQYTQAGLYFVGGVLTFFPPTTFVGLWILAINTGVDIGEYLYINWEE